MRKSGGGERIDLVERGGAITLFGGGGQTGHFVKAFFEASCLA
jgi:hypothetical protein